MLYYLSEWLSRHIHASGLGLFHYISFRAIMATILSLILAIWVGKYVILWLEGKQIGEEVRSLGLEGEQKKCGTATMGGIIIIIAIIIPTILFAQLHNVYIGLMLFATVGFATIGYIDDYIKVFRKNKQGLAGRLKVFAQVLLGLIIGAVLYFNKNVTIYRQVIPPEQSELVSTVKPDKQQVIEGKKFIKVRSAITTIPFIKNHEFNYAKVLGVIHKELERYTWVIYLIVVAFIVTAVSNGANLTDGLDGLAAGVSAIIGICLGVFAYVSGNYKFAEYFNILFIPNLSELAVFIGSFVGAFVGFLWYNAFPARIFMGDTGSLAAGGIIAVLSFILRKELMIPIFCGIFLMENLSVIIQVFYFKYTAKKYGIGQRFFLMAPLHHHYQKQGYHENKIVIRFWVVAVLCAIFSLLTIKIR